MRKVTVERLSEPVAGDHSIMSVICECGMGPLDPDETKDA